jgi:probable F420-dependent oxidoreductase
LRFGLALPQYDFSLPGQGRVEWPSVVEWAQRAEALGFSSVWLSDHLFYDLSRYGGPAGRQRALECFTGLGALVSATSRVRLGSLVACNDFRNPAVLAKMVSTLDVLSGGRVELGLGAGWFEAEYEAAGIPFDPPGERIDRLSESVRIVRRLLAEGRTSFEGRHYRLDEARCLPRPPSQLPVFVGGAGDRVARLAGRHADGFNSVWAWTPEDFAGRVEVVDRAAERSGRDPAAVRKTVGLHTLPGRSHPAVSARWERYRANAPGRRPETAAFSWWASDKLAGTYDQIAERVLSFEQIGVSEVILSFGVLPFQICDPEAVAEFMEEVAPLVI